MGAVWCILWNVVEGASEKSRLISDYIPVAKRKTIENAFRLGKDSILSVFLSILSEIV